MTMEQSFEIIKRLAFNIRALEKVTFDLNGFTDFDAELLTLINDAIETYLSKNQSFEL